MNLFKAIQRAGKALTTAAIHTAQRITKAAKDTTQTGPSESPRVAVATSFLRSIRHRGLTGLEIRSVRTAKHAFATRRTGRSKYMPDGVPCRDTKFQRHIAADVFATAA